MKFWVKTFGWAVVSGVVFFVAGIAAGEAAAAAGVATLIAVSLKTPFYAIYEWLFHRVWPHDTPKAEPFENLPPLADSTAFELCEVDWHL